MIIFKEESYAIMGAVFEVYKTLGNSFVESFYQKALEHEFKLRKIPFESQKRIPALYKNTVIGTFVPDFVCYDKIVVELKSRERTTEDEQRQVINYLNVGGYSLGILVNFGKADKVYYHRLVRKENNIECLAEESISYLKE